MDLVQEVYKNSDIFMPGVSELKMITGMETVEAAVEKAFEDNSGLELLVLKNGSKGSRLYTRNGLEETTGIYPVEQVDATGAGDSYDAAFICGLAEGKSLKEAAQMGAAAGALNAAAFGPMEDVYKRQRLGRLLEAEKRLVSDTIQSTVKKRREELNSSYDAEIGKAQEQLKKVRGQSCLLYTSRCV